MTKKLDYSIEFGHIYTNEAYSEEHRLSAVRTFDVIEELRQGGKTFSIHLLIDDYNPEEHFLDVEGLLKEYAQLGVLPDFTAREAGLAPYKDDMFDLITNNKIRKSYSRYIEGRNGKIPCSFMVATWYLIRLGAIVQREEHPISHPVSKSDLVVADKLINVLPERFMGVENQALKIIAGSKHSDLIDKIDWIFYNSQYNG